MIGNLMGENCYKTFFHTYVFTSKLYMGEKTFIKLIKLN